MVNKNFKILAVDDNKDNLISLKALIMEAFPEAVVLFALNGQHGLDLAGQEEPDVILLDILMPGMDGFEVCRKLKADKKLSGIPVVFVTALKSNKESRIKALECGAEAFLTKPIDEIELIAQIRAMLKIRKAYIEKKDENKRLSQLVEVKITELRQSEERFQLLFNKAPLGYQSLDSDGRFVEVNQQWLDTMGYKREEVIGHWFGEFLCPEYVNGFRIRFPIFKSLGSIHSEFEMLTKEGQCLFIAFEGKIGYEFDGKFKQTHCILQDITNQKKAEQALKQSEERYKLLFEYSGVGIGYYTPEGVVISFNKRALQNLSGKLENYVGKNLWELFPKEAADFYFARITKAIESSDSQEYEDHYVLDSRSMWLASIITRITDSEGEIVGVQIASIDITERKEAEEEIKKQNELFSSLLKLLPVGVFMVDAKEGKPLVVNDMGIALLGTGILPDANEQNLSEVYKAYKKDTMRQYPTTEMPITLGMKGISAHIDDMVIERSDGTKVLLEVFGTPVKDEEGTPWASLVTFMDITERKKAETELIYLSYHDHLTGFYNRRFFEEELQRLNTKENLPLSIIICDINGLKLINDSFGHNYGDILLIKAAKVIENACEKSAVIARIGGDEFAIVLPHTNAEETEQIADRIKLLASKEEVENIELSISYGYDTKTNQQQKMIEVLANAENHMYRHKLYARSSTRSKTIDIIMNTLFEKSNRESQHSNRVSLICQSIASKMGFDKDEVNKIGIAGLVHDIGKIGIDENILNKSEKLSTDEWKQIEKHPEIGWRILSSANEFLELAQFVLNHHEKWDGSGYPNGLKGEEIPLEARIIAVADAYDAMTSKRSYRTEISQEDALTELKRCAGTQFDPNIVEIFVKKVIPHDIFS